MKSTQATLIDQLVYIKGDTLAIPHYKIPAMFVVPGGKQYPESHLIALGFYPSQLKLWEREYGTGLCSRGDKDKGAIWA